MLLADADSWRFSRQADAGSRPVRGIARPMIVLTSVAPVQRLADDRLERLRLFACMMRREDRRVGGVATCLLYGGFSDTALHEAGGLALA